MTAALSIREAAARFGAFELGPLSLEVEPAEHLVILGPSGAGKTSLLDLIAGVRPSPPGRIVLAGRDIGPLPPHRRGIGYVSQRGDLFPHLTVAGNVGFGLRFARLGARARTVAVDRFLDLFGLRALAAQRAATLSGGESRRVAIARSLIVRPALLLLDEPLGMLDPNGRKSVLDALRLVRQEIRTPTLHVTHDREEVWTLGGRCAVLIGGLLHQVGPVAEVFRRPRDRTAALFLGAGNILPPGALPGAAPGSWSVLRPELIALVAPEGAPRAVGTVESVRDTGAGAEVRVRLAGDTVLAVHAAPGRARRLAAGDRVGLDWEPGDVHALEPEGDAP